MTSSLFHSFRQILWLAVALLVAGCDGADAPDLRTDSQGNIREVVSGDFVYQDNVRVLNESAGVEVVDIDGDSLVLEGQVGGFVPGDIIIKADGISQFTRRVASVNQNGNQTVVTTERVGLNDIFKEADIQETINLGPEFLETLQPTIPGVTFGKPQQVLAQSTEVSAWRLPIYFDEAIIADNGRGSVALSGEAGLRVGLRTDLQVGITNFIVPTLNRFELVPVISIDGKLSVKGTGSGDFRKEIPLTGPISYPLVGYGGLGLKLEGTLQIVVDGFIQSEGSFGIENASVRLEGGVKYENGQWSGVQTVTPDFRLTQPSLTAEANLNLSILQPKISLNLCDMGEIFLNAQILKLETEARFVSAPNPAYEIQVYRTFGVEAGARLSLGFQPLVIRYDGYFPLIKGERFPVFEPKVVVSLPRPNPADLFTLIFPQDGSDAPLRVGEERLLFGLTMVKIGILPLPISYPYRWSSSNSDAVRLTDYGVFAIARGVGGGSSEIRAVAPSGVTGYFRQAVTTTGLTGIQILPGLTLGKVSAQEVGAEQILAQTGLAADQVAEFGSRDLRAIGTYADGSTVDLTYGLNWSASGENAEAFRNGQLDGRLEGTSQLTVRDPISGRTAQATFEVVRKPVQSMHIVPLAATEVTTGQTLQLRASARYADASVREVTRFVGWFSSDPEIATVIDGRVTPIKAGEVSIFAIDPDGNAFAEKRVVVNQAALRSLRLTPRTPGPFLVGQTEQFRAVAVFADGTETTATRDVRWSTTSSSVATINSKGQILAVGPGTTKVKASLRGINASTPMFQVGSPAGMVFVTEPQDVAVGREFSVELEIRDLENEVWTGPVQVTLELEETSPNGQISGSLTKTSANGRVLFSGLTVSQAGQGYRLRAFASGLSIATSAAFAGLPPVAPNPSPGLPPVGPSPPLFGHLFFNNSTAPGGVGGLTVAAVQANGSFTQAPGSPYNLLDRATALTKIGNFVYVAIGTDRSLTGFRYDPAAGGLTQVVQTATSSLGVVAPNILNLTSGGGEFVISLATNDRLVKAFRVNSASGTLTLTDSEILAGATFPAALHYYDAPGSNTDYVYVSDFSMSNIRILALDTGTGLLTETASSPQGNVPTLLGASEVPGELTSVDNRLFVCNPQADLGAGQPDSMHLFDINPATGQLTPGGAFPVGNGPAGIHAVGQFLYIGNQNSADITGYQVPLVGNALTLLDLTPSVAGDFIAAGETNPHSFADVAISPGLAGLYVATSTKIAVFTLNTATGALATIPGSPFGTFASPGDIRH